MNVAICDDLLIKARLEVCEAQGPGGVELVDASVHLAILLQPPRSTAVTECKIYQHRIIRIMSTSIGKLKSLKSSQPIILVHFVKLWAYNCFLWL